MTDTYMTADDVLRRHWDGKLPVDVVGIAKRLGISVVRWNFSDGSISEVWYVDGVPTIRVQDGTQPVRARFAIAHSLGHFCLHREQLKELP
jgi:Zn-dependent peptidase ImmA (M78 family)